jgi:hypothetical protein
LRRPTTARERAASSQPSCSAGIFTAFYVRFRDLLANITAHFLGDFVLNVVLPLLGAG